MPQDASRAKRGNCSALAKRPRFDSLLSHRHFLRRRFCACGRSFRSIRMIVQNDAKFFPAISIGQCDGEMVRLAWTDFLPRRPRATISHSVCRPLGPFVRACLKFIKNVVRGVSVNPDRFLASILICDRKLNPCAPIGRTPLRCGNLLGITNCHYQPGILSSGLLGSQQPEDEDGAYHATEEADAGHPK